jgi:hypothetical protein
VNEDSGRLPGHLGQGLPLDHFNLNKFKGPEDGNFSRVRSEIVKMVEQAKAATESRNLSRATFPGMHFAPQTHYPAPAPLLLRLGEVPFDRQEFNLDDSYVEQSQ